MEEDVNYTERSSCHSCRSCRKDEKPGVRSFLRNGKEIGLMRRATEMQQMFFSNERPIFYLSLA